MPQLLLEYTVGTQLFEKLCVLSKIIKPNTYQKTYHKLYFTSYTRGISLVEAALLLRFETENKFYEDYIIKNWDGYITNFKYLIDFDLHQKLDIKTDPSHNYPGFGYMTSTDIRKSLHEHGLLDIKSSYNSTNFMLFNKSEKELIDIAQFIINNFIYIHEEVLFWFIKSKMALRILMNKYCKYEPGIGHFLLTHEFHDLFDLIPPCKIQPTGITTKLLRKYSNNFMFTPRFICKSLLLGNFERLSIIFSSSDLPNPSWFIPNDDLSIYKKLFDSINNDMCHKWLIPVLQDDLELFDELLERYFISTSTLLSYPYYSSKASEIVLRHISNRDYFHQTDVYSNVSITKYACGPNYFELCHKDALERYLSYYIAKEDYNKVKYIMSNVNNNFISFGAIRLLDDYLSCVPSKKMMLFIKSNLKYKKIRDCFTNDFGI